MVIRKTLALFFEKRVFASIWSASASCRNHAVKLGNMAHRGIRRIEGLEAESLEEKAALDMAGRVLMSAVPMVLDGYLLHQDTKNKKIAKRFFNAHSALEKFCKSKFQEIDDRLTVLGDNKNDENEVLKKLKKDNLFDKHLEKKNEEYINCNIVNCMLLFGAMVLILRVAYRH